MGATKRWLIELEQEKERKRDLLLDLPTAVEAQRNLLQSLEDRVASNEELIEMLLLEQQRSQQWKSRLREYVLGGIVGTVISLAIALVFSS